MEMTNVGISPTELYASLGTEASPLILDVRRDAAFASAPVMIAGAVRRDPKDVQPWSRDLPQNRCVVVYCAHGNNVSQGVASALKASGSDAVFLAGGLAAWETKGLPLRRRREGEISPSLWRTRERPKIDRIACPWLIRRFIEPEAVFLYVPADRVIESAREHNAIPYDVQGVEFTHEGERCTFDTLLRIYQISDPALDRLAVIVRGADTSRHDLAEPCAGLFAISLGLSKNFPDDHEMLAHGMTIYDALYVWCRDLQEERHNWPTQKQEKERLDD